MRWLRGSCSSHLKFSVIHTNRSKTVPINKAIYYLNEAGKSIDLKRLDNRVKIISREDMRNVPKLSGCYWIETTMPELLIFNSSQYERKKRKRPPVGTRPIKQIKNEPYIIYSGTESDVNKRLKQHLFNEGNSGTGKLGIEIDKGLYLDYDWYIYYYEVDDVPLRNALEIWWRHNVGWPPFCKR